MVIYFFPLIGPRNFIPRFEELLKFDIRHDSAKFTFSHSGVSVGEEFGKMVTTQVTIATDFI